MIRIDWPHRPDSEKQTIIGWVAMTILALPIAIYLAHRFGLEQGAMAFVVVAVCSTAMIALQWQRRKSLKAAKQTLSQKLISLAEIKQRVQNNPDQMYIGEGFVWDLEHARATNLIYHSAKRSHLVTDDARDSTAMWLRSIGTERPYTVPVSEFDQHQFVIGTTRSGKTRYLELYISQAALRKESVVIIDPKGDAELQATAKRAAKLAGLKYWRFDLAAPEKSVRMNPIRNFSQGTEIASRIASNIQSGKGGDAFKAFSFMAVAQIILNQVGSGERPTFVSIKQYLDHGVEDLVRRAIEAHCDKIMPGWTGAARAYTQKARNDKERAHELARFYEEKVPAELQRPDLTGLIGQMNHNREHFDKMVTSLMPVMTKLTTGELGPLLSPDYWGEDPHQREILDLAKAMDIGSVVYLGVSALADPDVGYTVSGILGAELAAITSDRYNNKNIQGDGEGAQMRPVNVIADEGGDVVNDSFIAIMNKGGQAKVRFTICAQTFADIVEKLRSVAAADKMFGNSNTIVALRVQDQATQEHLVQRIGKVDVLRKAVSISDATGGDAGPRSSTTTKVERERQESFPVQLFSEMPTLDYLFMRANGAVVKGRIPLFRENYRAEKKVDTG